MPKFSFGGLKSAMPGLRVNDSVEAKDMEEASELARVKYPDYLLVSIAPYGSPVEGASDRHRPPMGWSQAKMDVFVELREMQKLGLFGTEETAEKLVEGVFDEDIEEGADMKTCDLADLLCELLEFK